MRRSQRCITVVTALIGVLGVLAERHSASADERDGLWEIHVPAVRTPRQAPEGPFTEIVYLKFKDGKIFGALGRHRNNLLNYSKDGQAILSSVNGHLRRGIAVNGTSLTSRFLIPDKKFKTAPPSVNDQINQKKIPEKFVGSLTADGRSVTGMFDWLWASWSGDKLSRTIIVPIRATFRRTELTFRPVEAAANSWRENDRPDYGTPFFLELVSRQPLSSNRYAARLRLAHSTLEREYMLRAVDNGRTRFRSGPIVFDPVQNFGDSAKFTPTSGQLRVALPFHQHLVASPVLGSPFTLYTVVAPLRNIVIMRTLIITAGVTLLGGIAAAGVFTVRKVRAVRMGRQTVANESDGPDQQTTAPEINIATSRDPGEQKIEQDGSPVNGPVVRLRLEIDPGRQSLTSDDPVIGPQEGNHDD